jgi:Protein of unknown function (DUF2911)
MRAAQRRILVARLLCGVAALLPGAAAAQAIRKSQLASVTQMVGNTRIEIVYRRPVARGRALFGSLVPWDAIWSPSSDTAATVSVSTPVRVNGEQLPAGTYSLWAIPERDVWTLIFSTAHPVFHLAYPQGRDALRVRAASRSGEHMETLAFYFPLVDADSAVLNLHWGKTVVPLSIRSGAQLGR